MQLGNVRSGLVALALGALALSVSGNFAFAGKRVALVIGNAAYKNFAPLKNSVNDARSVKEALQKIGFETELVTDADARGFIKALQKFSYSAIDADAVVFYYAGHGAEESKVGYLLPTNVDAEDLRNPEFSLVPSVDMVVRAISRTPGPKIVIVDACREDPTARDVTVGQGLEVRNVAVRSVNGAGDSRSPGDARGDAGMLIVYSTAAKQVAYDGNGSQGPFASALVRHLAEPGVSVTTLFHEVNADVLRETGSSQLTNFYDSLHGDFKLNSGDNDELAWDKVRDSQDPEVFEKFIERFPNSVHSQVAARLRDLMRELTKQRDDERVEASAWSETTKAGTVEAYAKFIENFPDSRHATEAIQMRERLKAAAVETAAWGLAHKDNTPDAFSKFVLAFPGSSHKAEALHLRDGLLAAAAETAAWSKANKDKTVDAFDKFALAYPGSAHKVEALRARDELRAATAEAAAWDKASKDKTVASIAALQERS